MKKFDLSVLVQRTKKVVSLSRPSQSGRQRRQPRQLVADEIIIRLPPDTELKKTKKTQQNY